MPILAQTLFAGEQHLQIVTSIAGWQILLSSKRLTGSPFALLANTPSTKRRRMTG